MTAPNVVIENLQVNPVTGFADSWPAIFPLPSQYVVASKMPLHPVYPRPDGETNSYARHRNYHSDMKYQVPIGVQGGSWPFKYEIVSAPSGSTIGQLKGQSNYGVFEWLPSGQTGTQNFSVKVTDQNLDEVIVSWSAVLDNGAFVFIQDGYSGTKVGTIAQPLEDIADWYKDSHTDATYHNKIIVFRGGNYLATGNAAANPTNMQMNVAYKTGMLVAFPGESAVIDMQHAKIDDTTGRDDIYVAGLTFKNARNDQSNAHFFVFGSYSDRISFWDCDFEDMGYGTVGNDNPSTIFSSDPGSGTKNYLMLKQCRFDGINTHSVTGQNGSYIDSYKTNYVVYEENVARNSTVTAGFLSKGNVSFVSIRGNVAVENVWGVQFNLPLGPSAGEVPHDMELCWNIGKVPGDSVVLLFGHSGQAWEGQYYNMWCYRNTLVGQTAGIFDYGAEPIYTDGNIFAVDSTSNLSLDNTGAGHADIVVTRTSPILNSSALVTGPIGFATHGGETY